MLKNNKAQTTIFVVIGIILIIVFALIFFSSELNLSLLPGNKLNNQVSETIEKCIFDSASTGVFLLGYQGGYIEIPREVELDFRKYIDLGFKLPTWDSSTQDIPTIESMEIQLENYIIEDSKICIDSNLRALDFLNIEILGDFEVDATINPENVVIDSSYPIQFSEGNDEKIYTLDDYKLRLDGVRLSDMYDLGIEIFNHEIATNFIEDLVLDQIYSNSDYSSPDSMPSEGMSFSCAKRIWTKPQLKRNLANLNNNNFKYLYFDGTVPINNIFDANLNDEFGTTNLRNYFESHYVIELEETKNTYKNYKVEVFMPSVEVTGSEGILQKYPFREFEVTPSNGEIVQSVDMKIGSSKIPIPCLQIFHHLYTLDYDLIVKITDYNTDANYYSFQYPLRVDIKNNNPKVSNSEPILNEPVTATNAAYCNEEDYKYPLKVVVFDQDDNPLSDVNISYKCINLECNIGKTSRPTFLGIERRYSTPILDTNFPYCTNGVLIANKKGFHTGKLNVDTNTQTLIDDSIQTQDITLIKTKEFKVDVTSFLAVNENGQGIRLLDSSNGVIYATIENQNYEFESQVLWPTEEGILDTLTFLDRKSTPYNLSVIYVDEDYGLRGIFDVENWVPDINSGNRVFITVPASNTELDEDNFIEFYEESNELVQFDSTFGITFG